MAKNGLSRLDLAHIASLVSEGSRVLDVGCGDGELLALLRDTRNAQGRGLELSREGVSACVARGLSVVQGDADTDLADYPEAAFDYVILTRTIQAVRRPDRTLAEALRIGKRVVVSFPNFGYWKIRLKMAVLGRMPISRSLPDAWYETDNIHLCTIADFVDLCRRDGILIEAAFSAAAERSPRRFGPDGLALVGQNFLAEESILVLTRGGTPVHPLVQG